jgi:hypothetical protein
MAIRSGELTISSTDGIKNIADILGVSERWGRVIVSVGPSGSSGAILYVGNSDLSNTNYGLQLLYSPTVQPQAVKEFVFDQHENPAEDLYVLAADSTSIRVHVIAY